MTSKAATTTHLVVMQAHCISQGGHRHGAPAGQHLTHHPLIGKPLLFCDEAQGRQELVKGQTPRAL